MVGRARKDLETAKANINIEQFYASAFFSHQATEKALKALYLSKKGEIWKIHDLVTLAEELGAPNDVIESCDSLNPHYMRRVIRSRLRINTRLGVRERPFRIVRWS